MEVKTVQFNRSFPDASQSDCVYTCEKDRQRVCVFRQRGWWGSKGQCKSLAFSLNDAVGIYTDIHKHTAITDASSSVEQITVNNQAKGLHIMRSHIFLENNNVKSSGYNNKNRNKKDLKLKTSQCDIISCKAHLTFSDQIYAFRIFTIMITFI